MKKSKIEKLVQRKKICSLLIAVVLVSNTNLPMLALAQPDQEQGEDKLLQKNDFIIDAKLEDQDMDEQEEKEIDKELIEESHSTTRTTVNAGSYAQLQNAIDSALPGEPTVINLTSSFNFNGTITITDGKDIIIQPNGAMGRTLTQLQNVRHFQIRKIASLTLEEGVTLDGNHLAGGVSVGSGTNFTMNGSSIVNNNSRSAGGAVNSSGHFIMNGGSISDNVGTNGGGVNNQYGNFTMNGGTISYNRGTNGGGIYTQRSISITEGIIYDNTATTNGGGVYLISSGTSTLRDVTISNNTAVRNGGGIFTSVNLTVTEGTIHDNAATSGGGIFAAPLGA